MAALARMNFLLCGFHKQVYFLGFCFFVILKFLFFALDHYSGVDLFGGGNDSDYYHAYAVGLDNVAVNLWPVLLRWLNEVGLYSREAVSLFLKLIVVLVVPLLVARLAYVKDSPLYGKAFWMLACIVSAYPTLVYLATDVYRDVFMVFVWCLGLFVLKRMFEVRQVSLKFIYFVLGLSFSWVLFEFRPYLGLGYLGALLFSGCYRFSKYPVWANMLIWTAGLFALYILGILEPILSYRSMFHDGTLQGGSNIGIEFSSVYSFVPDFFRSLLYQITGFYFVNWLSVVAFVCESVLFLLALFYVLRNKRYADKFVNCLLVFFIVYASIWLLGNDNMGTATRLRVFNYISVYIAFFIIWQRKFKSDLVLFLGSAGKVQKTI
ncbi:hypothetical protein [Stutzerimonas nitrititolerans]|uniref:hypothetical protein n=1 Tax=Stutzerimonas nitrititolerans TaxID=2482751 RepID=UPI0028AA3EE4|nr:hypothetical protein [Stutzerimonas nitrititolerans]